MELFCRKRSHSESPPPVEVTVKRCASCPEAYKPLVNLQPCQEERGLLPRLFRHRTLRKRVTVTGGKWKSYDDVRFRSALDHIEESELGGSKVFNNPIYQPPFCPTSPCVSSMGLEYKEDTKTDVQEASLLRPSENPPPKKKALEEQSTNTSPPKPSLIGRLMESRRWKRKESKFVHTQPLYQDYCVYYTKGAPALSPAVFSVDSSLSFDGLFNSSLLGSNVNNEGPLHYTASLWQELPEVKGKGIAQKMSPQKRQLQEAIFEVVTSEASYQRSLSVATGHFQKSRRLLECLGTSDRHTLFSNLPSVREVSERFLLDLEEGLEKDIHLHDIGDRVLRHCNEFQRVYIPYVTNQMYQEKLMQQLIQENGRFLQVLQQLEEQPVCKRQLLKSFLVLPFQRITRLKILLENILKLSESLVLSSVREAVSAVGEIVSRCNEGVRSMMQTEELVLLEKRMDFLHTKSLPLISRGRVLVHQGELVRIFFQEMGAGHRPRLASKPIYLHLFSDLLLLSSKTDAGRFQVTDYARRGQVKADYVKAKALGLPTMVFLLRLTQNHSGLSCEIVLQASSELEKQHWISKITQHMSQESSC
ncbi:rho guanine nucleotide exchange factor 19-like isoform X2 [Ranitomeya variabilis]|uniref:rho guanine nucleotide exchange factor 19-like isoform X2 n=1 Tax=Ranitomeya variabilis TaxID=490064 RepID=UPI0040561C69